MAVAATMIRDEHKRWSLKQRLEWLRVQMETDRSTFYKQWHDCNDYILPRRGRFFVTDKNKGDRRNLKIKDTTATTAVRTLRAGMMAGISSPARPWFRLTHANPELLENEEVKGWLHIVTERMRAQFLRTNLYRVLSTAYGDLGVFGTAGIWMESDPKNLIHFESLPIGSFMISNDKTGRVNVMIREFIMSVRQIVDKFGRTDPDNPEKIDWTNITTNTKNLWDGGNPQAEVYVVHCVKPNPDWNPQMLESKYKKFSSTYYERGIGEAIYSKGQSGAGDNAKILRQSGFDNFMGLFPRWDVTGEDDYATDCPGFTAIGDIKQLQYGEKLALQGIEATVKPPMLAPSSLKSSRPSVVPGDITYVDLREGMQGFQPAYQLDFNVERMEAKQEQVRMRIRRAFYEDIFLLMTMDNRNQRPTATEADIKEQEKMLVLGPVLEQMNQDLHDPLIDNTYHMMDQAGLIPRPPEVLEGEDLKVEYISIMAQAQKSLALSSIERLSDFVAKETEVDESINDNIDRDVMVRAYGEYSGAPPDIIVPKDVMEKRRKANQEREESMLAAEQANVAADSMQKLGNTPVGGEEQTALDELSGLGDVAI